MKGVIKIEKILYMPHFANIDLKVKYTNIIKDIYSKDGYFNFKELIPEDDYFSIIYNEQEILQLNLKNIKHISENINLLNATTCLQVDKNQQDVLYPVNITRSFNVRDKYIVIFLELDNVKYDCPINVVLTENDTVLYSFMDLIPASNYTFNNFHRSYVHGINLDNKCICEFMNKNTKIITLSVSLLTGQQIYSQKIIINNTKIISNTYRNITTNESGVNLDLKF